MEILPFTRPTISSSSAHWEQKLVQPGLNSNFFFFFLVQVVVFAWRKFQFPGVLPFSSLLLGGAVLSLFLFGVVVLSPPSLLVSGAAFPSSSFSPHHTTAQHTSPHQTTSHHTTPHHTTPPSSLLVIGASIFSSFLPLVLFCCERGHIARIQSCEKHFVNDACWLKANQSV